MKPNLRLIALLFVLALTILSCVATRWTAGETLLRAKCGSCHLRPRKGGQSRAQLGMTLRKHARKFHLSRAHRRLLMEFLCQVEKKSPGAR